MPPPEAEPIKVSLVEDPSDFGPFFDVAVRSFGHQTHDTVWAALSPGWDTAAGREANAARMALRWQNTTKDRRGYPNTVFLKATVREGEGEERIVGVAIWAQLSFAEGWGDAPSAELADLEALYPDDGTGAAERERRFVSQAWASLVRNRIQVVRDKAGQAVPATFVLDLCAVDPAFQRRGVASRLVRWGLDEAERRGGLEATTEASAMGRMVYAKLGFRGVEETRFEVDDEVLGGRTLPSNLFMRTKP